MDTTPLIQIIIASTREQRRGEPIGGWFAELAGQREDLMAEVVDLAELQLPFLTHATPPVSIESRDGVALEWSEKVARADGYVVVTPEYNHGYPAALKNAIDHLFSEWARKPIGFVSYGAAGGGVRAVEQLRQVAIELEMAPVRRHVAIARVWQALDGSGVPRDPQLAEQAHGLLDDMAWWADGLRAARQAAALEEA
jgi:NAD(P)H-dependent FMN reductase